MSNVAVENAVFIAGSYNVDIVSRVESFPKQGETVCVKSRKHLSGGKGANQAAACRSLTPNTHFFAKIGTDPFAKKAKDHLSQLDLASLTLSETNEKATGVALITVSDMEQDNHIILDLGANLCVTAEDVDAMGTVLSNASVVLLQLENNLDAIRQILNRAKANGSTTILNPAPFNPEARALLPFVDIITPNETEASELSGIEVLDIDSAEQAAKSIHQAGVKNVIITLGSKGCLAYDGQEFKRYLSYPAEVVDTSGAGDSFNGALAACIANGYSIPNAINFANAYASCAVENEGAANMPDRAQVERKLASVRK
ncbi:ribokinase [Vibrio aestuarianus]|uniref:ribokinase n=1 Tax=Vibrio aestuarianus TaxID=28171 RepID=UPI0015942B27|nr:ribokinase [Vibrio aestuarianus]MDE1230086.1 ribokinase [Vibrio aestuarianus]MDE1234501.1 ribokinase [Vibrio aestuarianus]MDE1245263.1 ribokinase [Vibrio aestuarianus]MDE1328384.1 ribokinase [Vibrio aestuarianus]NGZ64955.1 ribokinase [Vibrio aestuarianus subsp. cardii]